ncbi:proto-oncogene Mas-like [Eublepharis macularius]|uniref:Proto-oncogene Mas-like n=1 Tax=Eublepharis macularius TaxID=481883 RepID=A0AA97L3P5_EUBMA|nr:proto-oncogene Mas-like [Eublepharis macularius]
MINSSLTTPSSLNGSSQHSGMNNTTDYSPRVIYDYSEKIILLVICVFGLVGDAVVIWLLGFRIKKNFFSIYILNLAVADFGVLVVLTVFFSLNIAVEGHFLFKFILQELYIFMYNSSQFLLAAISIDRCVCILFPIWRRIHQPSRLSVTVCALIWVISFLLNAIHFILFITGSWNKKLTYYQFFLNVLICLPVMTISTLFLLTKFCFKSQLGLQRKPLTIILLTLIFFLIFAFPLNAFYFINYFSNFAYPKLYIYGYIGASLNSSVNPLIYFLVGRQRRSQSMESIKSVFQRVFTEEQSCSSEL